MQYKIEVNLSTSLLLQHFGSKYEKFYVGTLAEPIVNLFDVNMERFSNGKEIDYSVVVDSELNKNEFEEGIVRDLLSLLERAYPSMQSSVFVLDLFKLIYDIENSSIRVSRAD